MQKDRTLREEDLGRGNWPLVRWALELVAEWAWKRLAVVEYELDLRNKNGHLERKDELEPKGSKELNTRLLADRLT